MKLKVSKKQLKEAERNAAAAAAAAKRRRAGTVEHCDYLNKTNYKTKRRRTDPTITFASYLEKVLLHCSGFFCAFGPKLRSEKNSDN